MNLKYKDTINQVVEELKQDQDILGVMLYGSLAEDINHCHSDIDLIVVSKNEVDLTKCILRNGIHVQMLIRSFEIFKAKLFKKTRYRPYSLYAKILYDRDGNLEDLLDEAKKEAQTSGPLKLDDIELKMKLIGLTQDMLTVEGLIDSDYYEGASLLMNELLMDAISCYYDFHGWFIVPNKRIIADLKTRDASLGEDASLVILSNDIRSRYSHLLRVRNHILELFGGEVNEYVIDFKK